MAASRCPHCSINYPPELTQCFVCDQGLLLSPYSFPDENWEDKARNALNESDEFLFIFVELYPHQADNNVPVTEDQGQLWVKHVHALEAGYTGIEAGTIMFLNNRFYEAEGFNSKTGSWWVTEVDPEKEFDDVPVLSNDAET